MPSRRRRNTALHSRSLAKRSKRPIPRPWAALRRPRRGAAPRARRAPESPRFSEQTRYRLAVLGRVVAAREDTHLVRGGGFPEAERLIRVVSVVAMDID